MKRTIGLLLVAMMLVACMATMAFAAEPGDTVTLTFTTSGNPGFGSIGGYLEYDTDALTLVSIEAGSLVSGITFQGNAANGKFGGFGAADVTGDGVLFTATFEINENAAAGTYNVSAVLIPSATSNTAGEAVTFGISADKAIVVEVEETTVPTEPSEPEETTAPTEPEETTVPTPTETEPGLDPVPPTGDVTPYIVMTTVLFMAAVAAAFTMKRKAVK